MKPDNPYDEFFDELLQHYECKEIFCKLLEYASFIYRNDHTDANVYDFVEKCVNSYLNEKEHKLASCAQHKKDVLLATIEEYLKEKNFPVAECYLFLFYATRLFVQKIEPKGSDAKGIRYDKDYFLCWCEKNYDDLRMLMKSSLNNGE